MVNFTLHGYSRNGFWKDFGKALFYSYIGLITQWIRNGLYLLLSNIFVLIWKIVAILFLKLLFFAMQTCHKRMIQTEMHIVALIYYACLNSSCLECKVTIIYFRFKWKLLKVDEGLECHFRFNLRGKIEEKLSGFSFF